MTLTTSPSLMDARVWTGKIFNGDWISSAGGEYPVTGPRTSVCGGVALARVLQEAGLPPGVFHVLPGGVEIGEAVVTSPHVRVVSFTGSTNAGRAVGELAARHLKRVHLELGGNSALIVLDDADLDLLRLLRDAFYDLVEDLSLDVEARTGAACTISLPTSVEPVNATLSTSGWAARAAPAVSPKPGTMFTTPSGMPASFMSSPSFSAESGVCSAGLSTMAQPAARAGQSFQAAMSSGKFQGMICPTTPIGSRSV